MIKRCWFPAAAMLALAATVGRADEIRYYEQDGVTYREVRRPADAVTCARVAVPTPVCRPQLATQTQDVARTYWTPVTQYEWEPYLVNRWNPFAEPYQEYRLVTRTRWEQRCEVTKVPVLCYRTLPQPVANLPPPPQTAAASGVPTVANRQLPLTPSPQPQSVPSVAPAPATVMRDVVTRMPVSGVSVPAAAPQQLGPLQPPTVARREQIGGVARYGEDPPRLSLGTP